MLVAEGLTKRYGTHVAVQDFDVQVEPGTIVGLVGNNGAGKSTVLKMLCGLLEPSAGSATLGGLATSKPAARQDLGFVPEDSPLYEELTPLALLDFFARIYKIPSTARSRRARELLGRIRLDEEHWTRPIGVLSKGSARKVALARALLHAPRVLVLDEPASGLDPATRAELDALLLSERAQGRAILLSAHDMHQVERLCDEVVIMHRGRVAARGTLAELRARWGGRRYWITADAPFRGSWPAEGVHRAVLDTRDGLWTLLGEVESQGATVIDFGHERPGLREILAALEER